MFINIPNNFSSMWRELTYEYNCSNEKDVVIEILDATDDSTIGVKKFYSTTDLSLNVAPIIAEILPPQPQFVATCSLSAVPTGFAKVVVSDGDECSEVRYFTHSKSDSLAPALLTTMPKERILYPGECDSFWAISSDDYVAKFEIHGTRISDGESEKVSTISADSAARCHQFNVASDQFVGDYSVVAVRCFLSDDEQVEIGYSIAQEPVVGCRLAWISSAGSVEHYTFPTVVEQSYLASGEVETTLRSAYGTSAEIEALSEILSSKKVWRFCDGEYREIVVLTTEQPIRKDGVLMVAKIKIREDGKG